MDPRLQEALNGPAKIISRLFSGSMVKRTAFFKRKLKKFIRAVSGPYVWSPARMRASAALRGGRIWI